MWKITWRRTSSTNKNDNGAVLLPECSRCPLKTFGASVFSLLCSRGLVWTRGYSWEKAIALPLFVWRNRHSFAPACRPLHAHIMTHTRQCTRKSFKMIALARHIVLKNANTITSNDPQIHMQKHTQRDKNRQTRREIDRQTSRQTSRQADGQADRHPDKQAGIQRWSQARRSFC